MDEATERKVRDLKLQILKAEKELAASQHSANLGAWLGAGHPKQLQHTAEKERRRLETKLDELRAKLEAVAPGSTTPAGKPKRTAVKKTVEEAPKKPTKKAAEPKPAAKKPVKKSSR